MNITEKIDMARLCSLSYEDEKHVQENFTNSKLTKSLDNADTKNILRKCISVPKLYSSDSDCQVYVCEYENKLVVCFRGTESIADILTDLKISQVTFIVPNLEILECPQVHRGFYEQFYSVQNDLEKHIKEYLKKNKDAPIIFTGHSLGGALATLASLYFQMLLPELTVSCVTFGSPRVGDSTFVKLYEEHVKETYRYVNDNDPVPCIPTSWRFQHIPGLIWLNEDKIQKEITVWRFYRFMKNTMMSWFGYGYNALEDHSCKTYLQDLLEIYI